LLRYEIDLDRIKSEKINLQATLKEREITIDRLEMQIRQQNNELEFKDEEIYLLMNKQEKGNDVIYEESEDKYANT